MPFITVDFDSRRAPWWRVVWESIAGWWWWVRYKRGWLTPKEIEELYHEPEEE